MLSLKINVALDCSQSQTRFLDHESCFNVFGPRIRVPRVEIVQKSLFSVRSISIGPRSTNGFSRCLGVGFIFPVSRYHRKTWFQQNRFSLVPGRPMGFRGKRTSDSSSPRLKTPWEHHFGEIPVYRLPSNLCRPRETDVGFEFPTSIYPWQYQHIS